VDDVVAVQQTAGNTITLCIVIFHMNYIRAFLIRNALVC
jgi:hypothetical protein